MSELKAFRIIQGDTGGFGAPSYKCDTDGNRLEEWCDICEVYLKSEADKVIAELQEKLDTTEKLLNKALGCVSNGNKHIISLARKNNRSNYKRCLAMAEMCKAKYDEEDAKVNGRGASWDYTSPEMKYWERWSNRWLELAEKFKEADK